LENIGVLLTFAIGLSAALVLGYLAHRVKLSPIVGYLLAGIIVGPFTPGLVADHATTEQFAEIGVILMLFGIGLKFELEELIAVWKTAVPGALIKSTLSTAFLTLVLHLTGMTWTSAFVLGMSVSVASTVVMSLVLSERQDLHSPIGHISIGCAVVEDLMTVAMLLLLPVIAGRGGVPGEPGQGLLLSLGVAGLKIFGLVAVVVVLGKWVIPWALDRIAVTRSRELFTLAVLVLAVGIAVGSAKLFGVSVALGAFLAGLAVGRSEFAGRAAGDAIPMRDAFSVLFFVSVGMQFDPEGMFAAPVTILIVLATVVLFKPVATALTIRALGKPFSTAIPVGAAFAQVGEFTFIMASVARGLGLIDKNGWNAVVAAAIISITLNPTIYRHARRFAGRLGRRKEDPQACELVRIDPKRSILIGYGPVGQIVCRLLKERGTHVTVIDLNHETVRKLKSAGLTAIHGDVHRAGTLEQAGITTAGSLILSADIDDGVELIRHARQLNQRMRILARCTHLRHADALKAAGADVVAAGEAEIGVALAEEVTASDEWDDLTAAEHRDLIRRKLYDNPRGGFPAPLAKTGNNTGEVRKK